jgi:hypothetical protein
MADNGINKRFFTNTYVTGSGRQNYLRIDHLEDPLFTSFTFDIDYVTSPLFYTINYSDYGYPKVEEIATNIENALEQMYSYYIGDKDTGYDILPVLSASILDGNKLGFGLQQNVYMDMPLYGATEYIYMVDKRNGGADQNDAKFDSNQFVDDGGNPNALNSYKLGDSVKEIVNDSDRKWAERKKEDNENQSIECQKIMDDKDVKDNHTANKKKMDDALGVFNENNKIFVRDKLGTGEYVEYNEQRLLDKIGEFKGLNDAFEGFKQEIVDWANEILGDYQRRMQEIYNTNKCVQKIFSFDDLSEDKHEAELNREFPNFKDKYLFVDSESFMKKVYKLFCEIETFGNDSVRPNAAYVAYNGQYYSFPTDDGKSFLLDFSPNNTSNIRNSKIIEEFRDKLERFGMLKKSLTGGETLNFLIYVKPLKGDIPKWVDSFYENGLSWYDAKTSNQDQVDIFVRRIMQYKCDVNESFDDKFLASASDEVKNNQAEMERYEHALDELRTKLYGTIDGKPATALNPSPNSIYDNYLSEKENYENDDYSQAEKAKSMANSGHSEMVTMLERDEYQQAIADANYSESIKMNAQPLEVSRKTSIVASQTVLDILGFIKGMEKMTKEYPYIIQGITGLENAYKNHYMIKDPYLGSGEDKITLTCLESLDLRVSSMFNRYFNAVYDRQYRRERVPVNLRRFNCSIYVHDVRNFVSKMRYDKYGNQVVTYNRLLELTDMYYSVIEFRFYDCEIVPEETGNIFNDISNEAPSEMKKTNFTFTYGNCVVNFVPQSEVAAH